MEANHSTQPTDRLLLSDKDVADALKLSRRSVWKLAAMSRDNGFPTPIRIGRAARWRREALVAYLDKLEADQGQ